MLLFVCVCVWVCVRAFLPEGIKTAQIQRHLYNLFQGFYIMAARKLPELLQMVRLQKEHLATLRAVILSMLRVKDVVLVKLLISSLCLSVNVRSVAFTSAAVNLEQSSYEF